MWRALLGLTPWMALTTPAAAVEVQTAVTLVYTHATPALDPPALRLGDECFVPISQAEKIGWNVELRDGKAVVRLHGRNIETFVRNLGGRPHIPLRTVVSAIDGITEWNGQTMRVYSKVRSLTVSGTSIEAVGTLPMGRKVLVLDHPPRVVLDLEGAKIDPNDRPVITGTVRFSQFTESTVRAVADVSSAVTVAPDATTSGTIVSARWSGGHTAQPAALGEPALTKDTAQETVISVPLRGNAPGNLSAVRDREGIFWVHLPTAQRAPETAPVELSGEVVRSATVVDRPGGGVSLRLELKRPMGVRVSSSSQELLVRVTLPSGAGGKISEKVIVVDAGHGGSDSGANFVLEGRRYYEKDFTLQIARLVADELNNQGTTVLMTRNDDSFPSLQARPAMANSSNADFFISIHINSNPRPNSMSGPFVYYHDNETDSKLLADCIQAELARATGLPDNGIRSDKTVAPVSGFAVLRASTMPAVLVEVAYINNTRDLRLLLQEDFRRKVAQAIVRGIKVYIGDE